MSPELRGRVKLIVVKPFWKEAAVSAMSWFGSAGGSMRAVANLHTAENHHCHSIEWLTTGVV